MAILATMVDKTPLERRELVVGVGGLAVGGVILALFGLIFVNRIGWRPSPYEAGALGLLFLWAAYAAATGHVGIWNAVRGDDGRASTSKFQVTLWTGVVVFAWIAMAVKGFDPKNLPALPQNVLIALGISVGTFTAAAAVTSTNAATGKEVKVPAKDRGMAPLFQSDAGMPDIGKIQLLAWTLLAVAVYLGALSRYLATDPLPAELPDIDSGLMALTGLGSATYLGKKLVSTTTTYISTISTNRAFIGDSITLTGKNFGATQDGGRVLIGDVPIETAATTWSDSTITLPIPDTRPDGAQWTTGKPLDVVVYGTGGPSANTVKLTLEAARVSALTPSAGPVGTALTITGEHLANVTNVAFAGSVGATPTATTDTTVTVTVPQGAVTGRVTVQSPRGSAVSETDFSVT